MKTDKQNANNPYRSFKSEPIKAPQVKQSTEPRSNVITSGKDMRVKAGK